MMMPQRFLLITSVFGLTFCWSFDPREAAAQDIGELQEQAKELAAAVENPLVQRNDLIKTRRDLARLLIQIDRLIAREGAEADEDHPAHAVHSEVSRVVDRVKARLPKPDSQSNRRLGLPVAEIGDDNLLAKLARDLRSAESALGAALATSLRDQEKTDKLIQELILAEEALAWEAGWPFNANEAKQYKTADGLTATVYLSRRDRGIKSVNQRLQESAQRVGRTETRDFVLHYTDDAQLQATIGNILSKKRGKAAAEVWTKGTTRLDDNELSRITGRRR